MGIITFNGASSNDFGIRVEKCPDYNSAERKVEFISVEDRNGDLVRDTGAYNNVTQTYEVYFGDENSTFQELSSAVSRWLLGSKGYCRLEDDYFPDVYRLAVYNGMIQNRNFMNMKGRSVLQFVCKPQRFLKSGEQWQSISSGSSFTNDFMPCFPVFEIRGNGTVSYGSTTITVSNNASGVLYVDTELQDAYTGVLGHDPFTVPFSVSVWQWGAEYFEQKVYLPSNYLDYPTIYFAYGNDHYVAIDTSDVFMTNVGDSFKIVYAPSDPYISIQLDGTQVVPPGGKFFGISGTVSSLINRNSDIQISGSMEPFVTGETEINHTVTALRIQPRTWTL